MVKSKRSLNYLRKLLFAFLIAAIMFPAAVLAQTEYRLSVSREFGSSLGSRIRGDFSIQVTGPEEQISVVTFLIDGQPMGEVNQAPFKLRFKTSAYPSGNHGLSAKILMKSGQTLELDPVRFEFMSGEQESVEMQRILIPVFGIVLLVFVFGIGMQFLTTRGKIGTTAPGTQRNYGIAGGAICPKCKRPTPRHAMGLNLGLGKLDRCENCGKWSILRAVPIDVLRAAEQAELELEKASVGPEKSEEEKLRDLLDKSKYTE